MAGVAAATAAVPLEGPRAGLLWRSPVWVGPKAAGNRQEAPGLANLARRAFGHNMLSAAAQVWTAARTSYGTPPLEPELDQGGDELGIDALGQERAAYDQGDDRHQGARGDLDLYVAVVRRPAAVGLPGHGAPFC